MGKLILWATRLVTLGSYVAWVVLVVFRGREAAFFLPFALLAALVIGLVWGWAEVRWGWAQ